MQTSVGSSANRGLVRGEHKKNFEQVQAFRTKFGMGSTSNSTNGTNVAFPNQITSNSSKRAQSKYTRNLHSQQQDAAFKYKVEHQFAPPQKPVPLLKAVDKKPAGDRLFQGIPGKQNRRRSDVHDIFNLPKSLGGNRQSYQQERHAGPVPHSSNRGSSGSRKGRFVKQSAYS